MTTFSSCFYGPKSDSDLTFGGCITDDHFCVVAAAGRGTRQAGNNLPCQDACAARVSGEFAIAAVCDGSSNAREGGRGAQEVARMVVSDLAGLVGRVGGIPHKTQLTGTPERVRESLRAVARDLRLHKLDDLATTVVACVLGPHGALLLHIGDGIGVAIEGGASDLKFESAEASRPRNGKDARSTVFLTDQGEMFRSHFVQSAKMVVLATDGGANILFGSDAVPALTSSDEDKGTAPLNAMAIAALATDLREAKGEAALLSLKGKLRVDDAADAGTWQDRALVSDDRTALVLFRRTQSG